ncbi:MAG: hypothetical protein WDO12_14540 [Pseudomonadota bacterium]
MEFAEVESFIAAFEALELPRERWTHEAHLVAGHWYAWRLGMPAALDEIRGRIRAHNESVGTTNTDSSGYHESITRLYMLVIDDHIARHSGMPFAASLRALLASPVAARDWPFTYYSRERLLSVDARRDWVPPDLHEEIP